MATYIQRLGWGLGVLPLVDVPAGVDGGSVGVTLGDPSLFASKFQDGGALWIGTVDRLGRPWFLLIAQSDGSPAYNWRKLGAMVSTTAADPAVSIFERVERANMSALGLSWDPTRTLGRAQTLRPGVDLRNYSGKDSPYERDPVPHLFTRDAYGRDVDAGRADAASASHVHRARWVCMLPKKGVEGGVPVEVTCNPWLRIAYISGLPGEHKGGDPVAEIVRTIADVLICIVAIYTGNVGLAIASIADAVTTWWTYAAADAYAGDQAEGWAKLLQERGIRIGNDSPASRGLMLTPQAVAGLVQSGAVIPTAAQVAAKQRASNGAGLALGLGALWLLLG